MHQGRRTRHDKPSAAPVRHQRVSKELVVHLTVLAVPGCPSVELLGQRLTRVLQGRQDVTVSRHTIDDHDHAADF